MAGELDALDQLIQQSKASGDPTMEKAAEVAKGNPELKDIHKQLEKIELTLHAMWIMMNNQGYTDAEFDQAMTDAIEFTKRKDFQLKGIRCPSCGKNAQLSNYYKIKCIYCGSEAVMHPYEVYNMLPEEEAPAAVEAPVAEEVAAEPVDPAFQTFEPYDVSKDLNFDEL